MSTAPPRRPTVEDVAREAGVSRQTVSNVLNAPERVSDSTRLATEAAIERLGYRSHALARNLRQQSARAIGYRVPQAQQGAIHPVLDRFLHALTVAARAEGKNVLLFVPDEDVDEATVHEEMLAIRAVDGLVLTDTTRRDRRIDYLAQRDLPCVAFGRTMLDVPHSWVDVDGAAGVQAAVRHLLERGHRRIAYVGSAHELTCMFDRRLGYARALGEIGTAVDPALEVAAVEDAAAAQEVCARLLTVDDPPTALMAASDVLAVGAIRAVQAAGMQVGREGIAVIGFDDSPIAPLLSPPLTTVSQPLEEAARVLVRLLSDRIRGHAPEGVLLQPELVIRASS